MENVKVIIWGLGAMGGGVADMLLSKEGVDIVGVAGREHKQGHSMFEYIKTEKGDREDVLIKAPEEIIKPGAADIVILCTDSFTKEAFPRMKFILEQGINCITSAEEMAYPKAQSPKSWTRSRRRTAFPFWAPASTRVTSWTCSSWS